MKTVLGAASEYGRLQVITWLCAWHISSRHELCISLSASASSVARLNSRFPDAKSDQTWRPSCNSVPCCRGLSTINQKHYYTTLRQLRTPSRETVPSCLWGASSCCTRPRPHVARTVQDTLRSMSWKVLNQPPHISDVSRCDFHVFIPSRKC
jgi:hypothetical protein